ncbi:MAG: hypothetical protein II234_01830, partial [Clostridia bacterium]|nr:hypothetical protein [Clostridia bacterium]
EVRPDVIYLDDFDTDKDCRNAEVLKKKWEWFERALYPTRSIDILKDTTIIPLFFENTCVAYSKAITSLVTIPGDGYIDFAQIIKVEE